MNSPKELRYIADAVNADNIDLKYLDIPQIERDIIKRAQSGFYSIFVYPNNYTDFRILHNHFKSKGFFVSCCKATSDAYYAIMEISWR